MDSKYSTLSTTINTLTEEGFKDGFRADGEVIIGHITDKNYLPSELKIVKTYRFEGMSNPQDDTIVFALVANDGNKGTLVMSYSAKHSQNVELIKKIPRADD